MVENCSTQSGAHFPGAFTSRRNLVVGPLALIGAGGPPWPWFVSSSNGKDGFQKTPLLVGDGHRVTLELSPSTRRGAGLAYGPLPQGETHLRDTHRVVTFIACRHASPGGLTGSREGSISRADGRPVTFWSGSVLARSPRCVPLLVWVDEEPAPRHAVIPLGVHTCAGAASRSSADSFARCSKWFVSARMGGKRVCLGEGRPCDTALRAQYARYGFACPTGFLKITWAYLRKRPLHVPQISPGDPCPLTTETGHVGRFPGLGRGPAYPLGTNNVVDVSIPPPEDWGAEWTGTKRVWLLDTHYRGRVLVRGRQLDGGSEVRFVYGRPAFTEENVRNPVPELRLEGFSDYPSLTRVRGPGCFAYQVDGRTFSYLVVFEARAAAHAEEALGAVTRG